MSTIPQNAKKVYDGILFDVYQFEIIGTDGKPRTFERVRGYDVAKAICIVDGKVLVTDEVHPEHKKISLPGGMLHKDEDSLAGVRREVMEETGYEFADWTMITEFALEKSNIIMNRYYYIAGNPIKKGAIQLDEGGEDIAIKEFTIDEFLAALQADALSISDLSKWYNKNGVPLDNLLFNV